MRKIVHRKDAKSAKKRDGLLIAHGVDYQLGNPLDFFLRLIHGLLLCALRALRGEKMFSISVPAVDADGLDEESSWRQPSRRYSTPPSGRNGGEKSW